MILPLHALVHRLTVFCITYHTGLGHLRLLPNSRPKIPKVEAHGKRVVTRHEGIRAFPPCSFHLLPVPFVTRCPVSRTGVIWRIGLHYHSPSRSGYRKQSRVFWMPAELNCLLKQDYTNGLKTPRRPRRIGTRTWKASMMPLASVDLTSPSLNARSRSSTAGKGNWRMRCIRCVSRLCHTRVLPY